MSHLLLEKFKENNPIAPKLYISQAVSYIERNELEKLKSMIPSKVSPLARSVKGILLKDIALYLKRMEIYAYLVHLENEETKKRVQKFDICSENIRRMQKAISQDRVHTVADLLMYPKDLFCNDLPAANMALLESFIESAHGKSRDTLLSMKPLLLRRTVGIFQ
jgi:hypothetical protein